MSRECFRADGRPKRVYADRTEAVRAAISVARMPTPLLEPYKCRHGHWHLGNPPLVRKGNRA